ncbi:phage ClpP protease [Streptococcus pseudoporcinus]|uniref:ATP-dependent Clp protease proteolytic subunit n=1 Tax=Streptococcus pseudoporcinus TaxID=361101 RepID=A0A4U9Y359_9STRE|nr:head maturation protease, ClpP-related [Streptococcus pseudoporcinus]QBX18723.1 Clp protease-like protein [Streptococcus phage Javan443]QBX18758.1 Clp protease-like protein [Streptococcus phage Javan445]VTS13495.1 phage ClpP protease [Streptococcus pseudoporcinus]VTS20015.1 phage ClpP protease [Streptococcus pseudoporcinus]VUC69601.1 phage ClpP protease [Streptococcus pseudoporcinus]
MATRINLKGFMIPNDYQEIYDFANREATSAKKLIDQLPTDNSDVIIEVNSSGGVVNTGSEIYTALRSYKGNVTAEVVGMAGSSASFAIMGADKVVMSPTAQIMIHKASFREISGNSDDLEKASDALKSIDKSIINAYVEKTGLDEEKLMEMMAKETYMSAHEAVELGFADEVMSFKAVASGADNMFSDEEITNLRNKMQEIENMKLEIAKEEILQGL